MIVGFTGVIWEGRPADRLAHDLHDGPGPARLAESGLSWAKVGEELAEIAADYAKILADLGVHWQAASYNHAMTKLTQLAPWLAEAAQFALETSARAEAQAAATQVALIAMPNPVEIAVSKQIAQALEHTKIAPGSPLQAAASANDHAQHDQKQRASRVMESYEHASQPIEHPWHQQKLPEIVSSAALDAEQAAAREAAQSARPVAPSGVTAGLAASAAMGYGAGGSGSYVREKSKYAVTELASGAAAVAPLTPTPSSTEPVRASAPMAPMAPASAAAGDNQAQHRRAPATRADQASTAGASVGGVALPEGWIQAGEHDSPATWADVEARHHVPEGVLDLDTTFVSPPVLGGRDGGEA